MSSSSPSPRNAPSTKQRSSTNNFRQQKLKLNPAFAAAHGISSKTTTTTVAVKVKEEKKPSSSKSIDYDDDNNGLIVAQQQLPPPQSTKVKVTKTKFSLHKLDLILKNARSTGKLNASNSGLSCPLPDKLFDLRLPVDLAMSSSSSSQQQSSSSYCYTEDTLTLIDLSDNSFDCLDDDGRFYVFKHVVKLRLKRCNMKQMTLNLSSSSNFEFLQVIDLSGNQLRTLDMDLLPSSSLVELHLQCNQIHTIKSSSKSKKYFPNLSLLDLSENKLSSSFSSNDTNSSSSSSNFDCFTRSTKLVTFRCSNNQLTTIPEFLLHGDTDDDGDGCCDCAPPYDTLQILDLSHNQIITTDDSSRNNYNYYFDLTDYTKLHTINLSFNKLDKVPCINPTGAVKHLQLNKNKLTSLDGLFPSSSSTTTTTNQQSSSSSSSLIDLLLHDNYIHELSVDIVQHLTALQRLDLSYNKLKNLPYQLGFLSNNINSLKVMGNPLLTFKSSDIDNNNTRGILQTLRNRAPKTKKMDSCSSSNNNNNNASSSSSSSSSSLLLTSGILRQNSIHLEKSSSSSLSSSYSSSTTTTTSLPTTTVITTLVSELMDSQQQIAFDITGSLILDGNKLESGIADPLFPLLPNLTQISMCDNLLQGIPSTLPKHCPRLKKLSLTKNRIVDVMMDNLLVTPQTTISWSKSLVHMDLSINRITEFPIEIIKQLEVLEVLFLSSNRIESTDSWDWLPPRLRILDLSNNRITNIDNLAIVLGACCQQSLQVLSFANNDIRKIPYELGLLSKTCLSIKHIDLKGNPQQMIRQSILDKSCDEQLDYLYNRMTKEQREKALASMIRLVKKNKEEVIALPSSSSGETAVAETVNKNDIPTTTTTTFKSSSKGSSPSPSRERTAAAAAAVPSPQQQQKVENMNGNHDTNTTSRIASSQTSIAGMKGEEKVAVASDNPSSSSIHDDSTTTPTSPPPSSTTNDVPPSNVAGAVPTPIPPPSPGTSDTTTTTTDDSSSSGLEELKLEISNLESELETNFSLSQAKRYAIKKSIAMARSKLIREERKLGLRK